jgi:hypothetical protein
MTGAAHPKSQVAGGAPCQERVGQRRQVPQHADGQAYVDDSLQRDQAQQPSDLGEQEACGEGRDRRRQRRQRVRRGVGGAVDDAPQHERSDQGEDLHGRGQGEREQRRSTRAVQQRPVPLPAPAAVLLALRGTADTGGRGEDQRYARVLLGEVLRRHHAPPQAGVEHVETAPGKAFEDDEVIAAPVQNSPTGQLAESLDRAADALAGKAEPPRRLQQPGG